MQYLTILTLLALGAFSSFVAAPSPPLQLPLPAEDIIEHAADIKGIDLSSAKSSSFWSCVHKDGYRKVSIRGYQQACGFGGKVDSNFLPSYKAARAAGFSGSQIDAYFFPCTGNPKPKQPKCKPIQTQIGEFLKVLKDNQVLIHRIWLDVEPGNSVCNSWNLGGAENLALARRWTAAMRATGLKWGIYGNGNEWTRMFPSRSSDIGSDLPLMAVQADGKPGVDTVKQSSLMGGWTKKKVIAKQYKLDTSVCGGKVDLDSFTE